MSERVLQGTGAGYQDKFIEPGSGGPGGVDILDDGLFIGTAEKINFAGGVVVAVDGGDPTQINVTITGAGVTPGFGIDVSGTDVLIKTSSAFTGTHKWTGAHDFASTVQVDSDFTVTNAAFGIQSIALGYTANVAHILCTDGGGSEFLITCSDAVAVNVKGTDLHLMSGKGNGTAAGGDVVIEPADSGGTAASGLDGNIILRSNARLKIELNGGTSERGISGIVSGGGSTLPFFRELNHAFVVQTSTTAGVAGGSITWTPGIGAATSTKSGDFSVIGADGPAASGGTNGGTGTVIILQGGAGGPGSGSLTGGSAGGITLAGLAGGTGTSTAAGGAGAGISLTCGSPGANLGAGTGAAGNIFIQSAIGRIASSSAGSSPNGTDSGFVTVQTASAGNATTVGAAGNGGQMNFNGGRGGNASSAFPGGIGTFITHTAGRGGAGSATQVAGVGGNYTSLSGDGGTAGAGGGAASGQWRADTGAATGAATNGVMLIGDTNASAVNISRAAGKIGFYGAAAVALYATTGTTTGFTAGAGTTVDSAATFTGNTGATAYTIGDIVRALKLVGLITT